MNVNKSMIALCLGAVLAAGCEPSERKEEPPLEAPLAASTNSVRASDSAEPPRVAPAVPSRPVVLIAGGDIDLSRTTGQRILRSPDLDPFLGVRPWLTGADLRFANLESQLCELGGKTVSEHNRLIFAGPPAGA